MTAIIRPMAPSDRQFVISTWSSSYRMSPYAGPLSMATYADVMHREIERIIEHRTTRVLVAAEPGEVDHEGRPFLYGFGAFSAEVLVGAKYVYYIYVKTPYRQGKARHGLHLGYAAQLLAAHGIDPAKPFAYACRTSYCDTLARKIPLATFDPFPARYLETHEQRTSQATAARAERPAGQARHPVDIGGGFVRITRHG